MPEMSDVLWPSAGMNLQFELDVAHEVFRTFPVVGWLVTAHSGLKFKCFMSARHLFKAAERRP